MGLNPLHFNGLTSATIFSNTVCGQPWYQYAWQDADRVSREEVARAIRKAELKIANEVGYNLIPDWIVDERRRTTRPYRKELYNLSWSNTRGQRLSVQAEKAYVVSGGIKASTAIEAGATATRSDSNGDSYDDLVTVSVATTVTDENEIRVYYPGEAGADEWEIKPINVSISGGTATITFNSWQLVDPDLQTDFAAGTADGDAAGTYLATVDVYRVYNDPQQQVTFLWEPSPINDCTCTGASCAQCTFQTQTGCLQVRDERLGFLTYIAADWDATNERFDASSSLVTRQPDQVRMWYYAGWRDQSLDRPNVEMDFFWEEAVAFYAASFLDREICGCENARNFIKRWQMDRAMVGSDFNWTITPSQADNVFGSRAGALYAFDATKQPDRKVGQ
ncbi:MAG: hypothetical protein ACW99X_15945 [Candidatus Thorarchaeota archaeon]